MPGPSAQDGAAFAGPWLRFGGGTGGAAVNEWHGSVLCATHSHGETAAALAATAATGPAPPPVAQAAAAAPATAAARAAAAASPAPPAEAAGGPATERGAGAATGAPPPVLRLLDASCSGEQELRPALLDVVCGWAFWRFDLHLQLVAWQRAVQYRLLASGGESTPDFTFWLPAVGQPMHWGYQCCNGFSESVPADAPERQDPTYLWRDLLQLHSAFPMHCLVGGGDQLYCDGVFKQSEALRAWGKIREHGKKVGAPWTDEMEAQATGFYLNHYLETFGQADICTALASIPQLMMWDDHDIWDGYGSYDPDMQECPVFQGLFRVARRFYLLLQQHTTDAFNSQAKEFLGENDGSAFHYLRFLGPQVALLGIDMRSQRTQARILPQAAYELLDATVAAMPPGPQHLVVLSGVPVVFPKVPLAERLLGGISRFARASPRLNRLLGRTGMMDRFDQPEILDDLRDGWVAIVHKAERLELIRLLQRWAATKALRVSILSGDAHVAGVGRLYSRPKVKPLKDDPLYMPQIVSSAILNGPPPHNIPRMLARTNWASRVDKNTKEKMVRAFYPSHPRTDKLLAQRNWCDITLVAPPFSPPVHPSDPMFGGLRFVIRAEVAQQRRGHAEECYTVTVPRHPAAAKAVVATGAPPGFSSATGSPRPGDASDLGAGAGEGGEGGVANASSSAGPSPDCPPYLAPELELRGLAAGEA